MASSCRLCRLFSNANCQIRQTGLILADPAQDGELSNQQTVSPQQGSSLDRDGCLLCGGIQKQNRGDSFTLPCSWKKDTLLISNLFFTTA